jgi:putative FmdB family regulatory protein
MPTYEYKCSECEEVFEFFQRMTDEPMKTCPVCAGRLNRLISGGMGVIFKGSGFYTTDYKNSSHKKFDAKSKKEEPDTSVSSDTKKVTSKSSDNKPEKKTETASN